MVSSLVPSNIKTLILININWWWSLPGVTVVNIQSIFDFSLPVNRNERVKSNWIMCILYTILGPVQTPNFACGESNANEQEQ